MIVQIPAWMLLVFVLILPLYFMLERMWTTFDNWIKFKAMDKPRKPIGFQTQKEK